MKPSVVVFGKRTVVVAGVIAGLAVGRLATRGFAAQGPEMRQPPSAQAGYPEPELKGRVAKLEEQAQRVQDRIDRLERDTRQLDTALKRSEATVATLSKQVKTIAEAQERLARSVSVDPSGAVRITGNLRLDNNAIDDIRVVTCDAAATSGQRQCTCPEGLITIGIELKPLALSAYPGPATYNTALVCGRL